MVALGCAGMHSQPGVAIDNAGRAWESVRKGPGARNGRPGPGPYAQKCEGSMKSAWPVDSSTERQ